MFEPLIIGEAPGASNILTRHQPLWPNPPGCTGARLAKMTGLSPGEYIATFGRINLFPVCPEKWSRPAARAVAEVIRPVLHGRKALLLGRKVLEAFGHENMEPLEWVRPEGVACEVAWMPHPSGRNHWYNQGGNRQRAERFMHSWVEEIRTQRRVAS